MHALCIADHCGIPHQHQPDCPRCTVEHQHAPGCIRCYGCLPREAADGLRLCVVDTRRLVEDARTAGILHEDLALVLIRKGRGGEKVTRSSSGAPVPDDDTVEARTAIRATLVGLCRLIAYERGTGLPADDVLDMGAYVGRHAVWLAAHPAADEHARDLRDVAGDPRTRRLAYPAGTDRLYIGDCPLQVADLDGNVDICGTRLYQYADQHLILCSGCGTEETVEWWQLRIVGEASALVDAYAGAADLSMRWKRPVDPALIRKWASLGKVGRCGKDARQRTLYDLAELRTYAEKLWDVVTSASA